MSETNDLKNTMSGNNVYILTDINSNTTADMISKLSQWIDRLSLQNQSYLSEQSNKIYSPYETIPNTKNILNVYISSFGGKTLVMQSILTLFDIASAKGAIIKTYNLAHAGSSASIIAISGSQGYRYMGENAYNTIHFGSITGEANHIKEIEYSTQYIKNWYKKSQRIYLSRTKLTQKELNKYYNIEGSGTLYADQCLTKGLCDWIITTDGRFVNSVEDLKSKQR